MHLQLVFYAQCLSLSICLLLFCGLAIGLGTLMSHVQLTHIHYLCQVILEFRVFCLQY